MTPTTETVSAPEAAEAPAASATPAAPAAPREGRRGRRKPRPEGRPDARPDATPKAGPEAKGGQRAPRKANAVLERLFELYPKMFGARFRPLKLGVYQELLALHPDVFKKEDLKIALGLHARSTRYLDAVAAGEQRHDLNGVPVEPVAPEHVHHAILEVFKRRQARTAEDLRPKLRARLVEAIEASGLSREDYVLAVRTQDEVTNAVLDEAFVEVGARTAKREALLRAFEASGRTVAEFAEMYGMDPAEVGRTLARARPAPGG
ncbi:ProQ/FINO family protein [Variovorax sp. J31P179]|uniref:ProQ/FINO family protein n=1 Tax=Variovorax sp. J31P179 TaxID=3053508 RepID=UPI0025763AF2|nr:ProQ/FINO family protein [Variovorax sp. J31P179]MDM0081519.1 ProQ/FINO family protein [Variovorax sp. J31P179]HET7835387.1 ProQ/FINO family protein [Variovorax sp.]